MPKELKETVADRLNTTAKELYGIIDTTTIAKYTTSPSMDFIPIYPYNYQQR